MLRYLIGSVIVSILLLAGTPPVRPQDKPLTRKIAEFTHSNWSSNIANLDILVGSLQQEPSARGFIIVYRPVCGLPGLSNRYGIWAKAYLTARGVDPNRVVVVDGSTALVSGVTFELWVVAVGATPAIRKEVYENDLNLYRSTIKYDEHYRLIKGEYDDSYDYTGLESSLDGFAKVLQQQSDLQGYIIGYGEPKDSSSQILKLLREEKNYLVKTYALAASRIKIVNGGYRKYRLFELWLVPPDDAAPQPLSLPLKRKR